MAQTKSGAELISEERIRQLTKEGYTSTHDDKQDDGALAIAGAAYALDAVARYPRLYSTWHDIYSNDAHELFPWDDEFFKPTPDNPIRQLTKAGALIAAEIDRLQRLKPTP